MHSIFVFKPNAFVLLPTILKTFLVKARQHFLFLNKHFLSLSVSCDPWSFCFDFCPFSVFFTLIHSYHYPSYILILSTFCWNCFKELFCNCTKPISELSKYWIFDALLALVIKFYQRTLFLLPICYYRMKLHRPICTNQNLQPQFFLLPPVFQPECSACRSCLHFFFIYFVTCVIFIYLVEPQIYIVWSYCTQILLLDCESGTIQ